ncbi:hypothetical protein BCR44DRAFT_1216849 [Catenaria anguillulae PL171]|uniref:Uncharacterized protein n=1 Tax=Catenaria anguillulae PL171 TaxID=765915 RepID=A0A1Y2HZ33_9FUNG|nr:hypothetical protein BCR44DRAFT_1216849 [Catenaria anguillulae PL171]
MPGTTVDATDAFFAAIEKSDSNAVRDLLGSNKELAIAKKRGDFKYPKDLDLESLKFMGGYIGSVTGLQLAILLGHDAIAKDILDSTFKEQLNETFGGNNTALHLAAFLGARDIVKLLLERGADRSIKNGKGFTPVDIADDGEMQELFTRSPVE